MPNRPALHKVNRKFIALAAASQLCPGGPDLSTLWRWSRYGVSAGAGVRVHLRVYRSGKRLFTTTEDVAVFLDNLSRADAGRYLGQVDTQQ